MQVFLDNLLPIAIVIIMAGIGLNLKFKDFSQVFIAPKAIILGLIGQLLILPLIGFLIAYSFPIEPAYKIGIVLISACPGGTSSNIVSFMLRGRVALSVSITAFNSIIIVLTIPTALSLAFFTFENEMIEVELSFLQTFKEIGFTVLLPVIVGVLINEYYSKDLRILKKYLRYILPTILFLVFSVVIFNESESDAGLKLSDYTILFIPLLLLNIGVMWVGYYLSKFSKINHKGAFTIAIEMGLQNTALAIFISNNVLGINSLSTMAVIYGGFSFFTTLGVAYFMKKKLEY